MVTPAQTELILLNSWKSALIYKESVVNGSVLFGIVLYAILESEDEAGMVVFWCFYFHVKVK